MGYFGIAEGGKPQTLMRGCGLGSSTRQRADGQGVNLLHPSRLQGRPALFLP